MDSLDVLREAEIRALDLIGRDVPDVLQRLVRTAAHVCGASGAEVNVVTATSQYTLASAGGEPGRTSATDSFCARVVRQTDRSLVVPDAREDARFRDSAHTIEGRVRSYAASQLVTSTGTAIGTLCVFDPDRREFGTQTLDSLTELAEAVVEVLEASRHQEELADSVVELAQAQRELRRSNEHLAAFAGQVGHDVQGPLATVILALQLLEESLEDAEEQADGVRIDPEETRVLMRSALAGAQRMRTTVTGLLDFAVVGGSLKPVTLDLATIVRDVLSDLDQRVGRTEVAVGPLPPVVGDEVQVRALLQNFLANAFKYASSVPQPCVRVHATRLPGRTRIAVSDNGPGIPEDEREAVFAFRARGRDALGSSADGLGIGLATCRRIALAHGGEVGVDASEEGGAEFWFVLPDSTPAVTPTA